MLSPIGVRGSRLAYGSWKMICIRRRYGFSAAPLSAVSSSPSNRIEPAVGSMRRRISRPTVVLPQPDSPTSPSVSPRRISKLTPSTAWTIPIVRCRIPPRMGKCLTRSVTLTSGGSPGAGAGRGAMAGWARLSDADPSDTSGLGHCAGDRDAAVRPGQEIAALVVISPAPDVVAGADRQELRVMLGRQRDVLLDADHAAWREAAADGQVDQVRDVARDDRQLVLERPDDGDRPDQSLGVRVERIAEQRRHVGLLDDLAGVHDRHPVAHLGDDAQVVGDQHDGRAGLVAQVAHEVEDLRLDRHVEGRRRLVGDQQLGLAGKGHGDHHALGHAARHLVRERLHAALRVGDADHPEQLEDPRLGDLALQVAVDAQDLRDLLADLVDRIER